jgi:parvulin-like peptidyl-prolyl isomerase
LEQAAFALQVNQVSDPIQINLGYELIEVLERDPQRPLSANVRLVLQNQALAAWVKNARANAKVDVQTAP